MKALSIFHCNKFDISETISLLDKKGLTVGTVSKPTTDHLIISDKKFSHFNCTYNITIKKDILALINGTYEPCEQFQQAKDFSAFYSKRENLLIIAAPRDIVKEFIKTFQTYPDKIDNDIKPIDYNFNTINGYEDEEARALYFNVDDTTINSKHFFGVGVDQDEEAKQAIDNKTATYLMATLDILGKARTIGFSKSGAMVIYNNVEDIKKDYPFIELAIETLKSIKLLK